MAYKGLISESIPDEVKTQVIGKLNEIDNLLKPYYIDLSVEQKRKIPKIADELQPFVEDCINEIQNNDEFLPKYADTQELIEDKKIFDISNSIFNPLSNIANNIDNILTAAGSDIFVICLAYYHNVQRGAKLGVANARPIFERLRVHFESRGRKGS